MPKEAHREGASTRRRCGRVLLAPVFLCLTAAAAGADLFERPEPLELEIEARFAALVAGREESVEGHLRLADRAVPVTIQTYGLSRLRECDLPPLKLTIGQGPDRDPELATHSPLRIVTHCRTPSLERHTLLEYLAYRSYAVVAAPALGVRAARARYRFLDRSSHDQSGFAFLVEDIDRVAERHGLTWTTAGGQRLTDLDPRRAAILALFQYMIGNTDWSMLSGPPGERCCHNVALLESPEGGARVFLPFDFDQSGLVDAPYAVPDPRLRLRDVSQRAFRGLCRFNEELPAAIEHFNRRREELAAVFADEALPQPPTRAAGWRYVNGFFAEINDPKKLEKRIAGRCR